VTIGDKYAATLVLQILALIETFGVSHQNVILSKAP
jgi:hypothetical protein